LRKPHLFCVIVCGLVSLGWYVLGPVTSTNGLSFRSATTVCLCLRCTEISILIAIRVFYWQSWSVVHEPSLQFLFLLHFPSFHKLSSFWCGIWRRFFLSFDHLLFAGFLSLTFFGHSVIPIPVAGYESLATAINTKHLDHLYTEGNCPTLSEAISISLKMLSMYLSLCNLLNILELLIAKTSKRKHGHQGVYLSDFFFLRSSVKNVQFVHSQFISTPNRKATCSYILFIQWVTTFANWGWVQVVYHW
jgi:hypothetical protein